MHIFVGSTNPVKINAVVSAAIEAWPDVKVEGFDVESNVSAQPRSDEETKTGAINRAKTVLNKGLEKFQVNGFEFANNQVLGVGLEGGVFEDKDGQMWSTVWAVVVDKQGDMQFANGARFKVPDVVAKQIKAGGEMGPIIAQVVGQDNVKQKQGMIGIITKGFVDRTQEYEALAKLAIGLWYGKDWLSK